MKNTNYYLVCFMSVFLYGCGGSGGSDGTDDGIEPSTGTPVENPIEPPIQSTAAKIDANIIESKITLLPFMEADITYTNSSADTENLDSNGLPIRTFEAQLPVMPNDLEYIIDISAWDIPNNRTDAAKTTSNLQAAIDWAHDENYSRIVLPNGHYLVGEEGNSNYQAAITLHGDTELVFNEGAVIEIDTNNKWNYCILNLDGDNIIIRDGMLIGDRNTHIFTPRGSDGSTGHDEGHGICVWNTADRILIQNMDINNTTGDGALVLDSSNITFENNNIYNNRRQGISIVGGTNIEIRENEIHHINGTSPQFGIDIEGAGRVDDGILIEKNYFHHNAGGDIVNTSGDNVYILDNVMEQGEGSSYTDGPIVSRHKTHNIIARNTVTMINGSANGRLGYIQYSGGGDKGHNRATYVHENVCNNCGMYMYRSSDADVRRNQFLGYFMAFGDFEDAVLINNLVTYSYHEDYDHLRFCWNYRFKNTTGFSSNNYLEENVQELPLSETTAYSLQCVLDGW